MYTTISGGLSENTEWVAGTYYLEADCQLGNYNLTLNCSAGNIIIKTSGDKRIILNGTGIIETSNSDLLKKVIFTSVNDDLHGEVITGSSGSPAIGDQSKGYLSVTANNVSVDLRYTEWWYCEVIDDGILDFGNTLTGQSLGISLNLLHITFKYCGIKNGAVTNTVFIGQWRRTGFDSVTINGIYIDSTNRVLEQTETKGNLIFFGNATTISIDNINIDVTCTNIGYCAMRFAASTKEVTITLETFNIKGNYKTACLMFSASGAAATMNLSISSGIIDQKDNTVSRAGISIGQATGAVFNFTMRNTTICNSNVGIAESGSITYYDEDYNNFYNNLINASRAIGAHSSISNPILTRDHFLIGQDIQVNY